MFEREYGRGELNQGIGMLVHPVSGTKLSELTFDQNKGVFFSIDVDLLRGWDRGGGTGRSRHDQKKISDGKKRYKKGDAFPLHWRFNPWTGAALETRKVSS